MYNINIIITLNDRKIYYQSGPDWQKILLSVQVE